MIQLKHLESFQSESRFDWSIQIHQSVNQFSQSQSKANGERFIQIWGHCGYV